MLAGTRPNYLGSIGIIGNIGTYIIKRELISTFKLDQNLADFVEIILKSRT